MGISTAIVVFRTESPAVVENRYAPDAADAGTILETICAGRAVLHHHTTPSPDMFA